MKYRRIPRMDLEVSEIGLGTWGMGGKWWGPTDDAESIRAIHRAMDLGVNLFDTAYTYGDGHSERILAEAFRRKGRRGFVATKIPPMNREWPARHDVEAGKVFPGQWIRACTERSLLNLETDCLDLQQLHVWSDSWLGKGDWEEAVRDLKEAGKIRFFGVSINDHDPDSALRIVASGLADAVQVIYNIFDQSPERRLFSACREKGIGVIVRVPLDEGGLSGALTAATTFAEEDFRRDYFGGGRLAETVRRAENLRFLIRREIRTLPQGALKFCLGHPAVSTVIPGMRTRAHVEENCAASDGVPLGPEEIDRLRAHAWERNFYG
ncbi:MAG: aldo/keto reductase [Acidobacteria bacterium]|nr:aldo/keto reductase [Acidobacteriota bacterium]